jgi:hypothetical protein
LAVKGEADSEVVEVVYAEAIRSLEGQRGALDNLRGRSGILLSAASIASSFLGGIALGRGTLSGWGWAAIVSFGLVGVLSLVTLWPFDWVFGFDGHALIRDYIDRSPPATPNEIRRNLAILPRTTSSTTNASWIASRHGVLLMVAGQPSLSPHYERLSAGWT